MLDASQMSLDFFSLFLDEQKWINHIPKLMTHSYCSMYSLFIHLISNNVIEPDALTSKNKS